MAENSKIEWCHHTFNPWVGCAKVSDGCKHCYAETLMDTRYGRVQWGIHGTRQRTSVANWKQPLRWDKQAQADGVRHRVFCASLADVMEDREELHPMREDLFKLIKATPNLDWLLLTKRPENYTRFLPEHWLENPLPNVWLGTSVENQAMANERIPHLVDTPAAIRFLSMEPLLEYINLDLPRCESHNRDFVEEDEDGFEYCYECAADGWSGEMSYGHWLEPLFESGEQRGINWVIVGGESGRDARPMHPEWVWSLRDQCVEAGVPFFFKQWGEWFPRCRWEDNPDLVLGDDSYAYRHNPKNGVYVFEDPNEPYSPCPMHRVGKAKAGRILDGRTWDDIPTPKEEPK